MQPRDTPDPSSMPTVLVQDLAASWEHYREITSIFEPAPRGLRFQLAGPTDEGVRIVAVWRSPDDWRRFQANRLEPALVRSLHRLPAITLRELRVAHLIDPRPVPLWPAS